MKTYTLNGVQIQGTDIKRLILENPELLKEESKSKFFSPKNGENAYYIAEGVAQYSEIWSGIDDQKIIEYGVYRTSKESDLHIEKQKAIVRLWNYADENMYFRPDWNKSSSKYYLYFSYYDNEFKIDSNARNHKQFTLPYFESRTDAEQFIKDNKEDLELLFLK